MIITKTEKSLSIKHHSKLAKEIESFVEVKLNEFISQHSDLQRWVSGAMGDSVEWMNACRIIEKLFSQIKHREQILKNLEISIIQIEDKKTKKKQVSYVRDNLENKDMKITRWEIYNAITRYITHGEQITPFIESLFHKYAEKVLVTPTAKLPMVEKVLTV